MLAFVGGTLLCQGDAERDAESRRFRPVRFAPIAEITPQVIAMTVSSSLCPESRWPAADGRDWSVTSGFTLL